MFTISASRISVKFVAFITVVSLILSAFPASFFVAFAQEDTTVAPIETPAPDETTTEEPVNEGEETGEPTEQSGEPADENPLPPENDENEEEVGFFANMAARLQEVISPEQMVTICHMAGQSGNYQSLEVSENSILNTEDQGPNGHGNHDGDIIPPFGNYGGQNWNAIGQATHANGCVVPEVPRCEDNLLANASFEEPVVTKSEKWDKFGTVSPWTITKVSDDTPTTLELMRGWNGNVAAHGEQYAELDGEHSTKIAQTATTLVGGTYELSWAFAPRHNIGAEHNELGVSINGTEVATNGPTTGTSPLAIGDWTRGSEIFVANSAATVIEFADLGPSNTFGTFLDDVQLCLKREPPKPVEPEVCSIAGEVVAMTANAVKFNGQPVDANRRTTGGLATVAPYSNFFGMDGNGWNVSDFLTLGVGGYVTYKFTDKVAVDQAGPDIAIWEITGGPTNQVSNAKAIVEVSQDGAIFFNVGTITGDGQVDISATGLDFVRYVRVTDDSLAIGNDDGGDGYDVDAITIIDGSCSDTAEIVAHKIVCESETSLPNFGTGGPNITSSTAADFIAENPTCALVPDWQFEWSKGHVANPGDAYTGVAGGTWNTFGPTDANGMTSVSILEEDLGNGKISLREVLQTGYIPFTYQNDKNNSDPVTAEFYCASDVVNYDNLEYITVAADTTYHCVAWNVAEPKPASCDLTIVSDTQTVVEDTNTYAVATYDEHPSWTASIPGATWIWELLQVLNPTVDTTRTFVETFTVTNPTNASLTIAADNGYEVFLNGVSIANNLAVENNFQIGTQDIIPLTLIGGANELKVVVKNFAQAGGTYQSNPAGALYKLTATGTDDCGRTTTVKTSGPVTMCKMSSTEEPLAGWTLTLLGDKVDDVVVPSTNPAGVNTTAALAAGTSYVAVANGTWNNQGGANVVDAEYSTTDGWATAMDGYTGYSTDILELQINSTFDPASNWGAYNAAHTYAQSFTQVATGSANFRIFDGTGTDQNPGWFGDNSGELNVAVYEGFSGITGENGCVTFQNVPYGTYTAGEMSQPGWEYVSGAGEVVVSQANDDFTLVNRYVPTYTETTETIIITGNTTNLLTAPTSTGWYFDSYAPYVAPYAFLAGNPSIGSGSLKAGPVGPVGNNKFIGAYQGFWPVKTLKSIAYDFKIEDNTAADENEFYLNIYANFGASAPTKFYDCRYDVVPTTGSLSSFTTVTYNVTDAKLAQQSGSSPFVCPATLAEMETVSPGAVVRAIALNVGDTGTQDEGVTGYFDNVVVMTQDDTLLQKKTTIYDFEPAPVVTPEWMTIEGYKYECYNDDGEYCVEEDGIENWLITATNGTTSTSTRTNEDGYYSFILPVGEWTISEEMLSNWEQIEVIQNGEPRKGTTCTFEEEWEDEEPSILDRVAAIIWEPEYTCSFGNLYDEDNGDGDYTDIISGFKWNDLDGNGTRGESEPTIAGWVIGLYDDEDNLVATTSTNGAGFYSFEVESGEWTVGEVQQSGWTQTGTLRNNIPQLSEVDTCTFYVYEYESYSRVSEEFAVYDYEENNTCDFGNQQDEVIQIPDEPRQSSNRSSGTRTRAPQGQVLGATTQCGLWLEDYMQKATVNNSYQVLKLQVFLNLEGFVTPLTAVFDEATEGNVKLFQTKYFDEVIKPWFERGIVPHNRPTGFVYKTTRWKINDIMCPGIEPYPSFEGENLTTNVLLSR